MDQRRNIFVLVVVVVTLVNCGVGEYFAYNGEFLSEANSIYGFQLLNMREKRQILKDDIDSATDQVNPEAGSTIEEQMQRTYNLTADSQKIVTNRKYYDVNYFPNDAGRKFDAEWKSVESFLDDKSKNGMNGSLRIDQLVDSHRRALRKDLPFSFRFYGVLIQNITIATGGFVYLGSHVLPNLAATMYVAPLMADFATVGNDSVIQYAENESMIVIEWHNLPLKNQPTNGNFTFQLRITKRGFIGFYYKDIPIDVPSINSDFHPKKVGISDAFLVVQQLFGVFRRNLLVEYHMIEVNQSTVLNKSVITLVPKPTCLNYETCADCQAETAVNWTCSWCPFSRTTEGKSGVCSDLNGLNRFHQVWQENGCDAPNRTAPECPATSPSVTSVQVQTTMGDSGNTQTTTYAAVTNLSTVLGNSSSTPSSDVSAQVSHKSENAKRGGLSSGAVFGIILVVFVVLAIGGWLFYAYKYPHSPSGQFLIQYRPSRWRNKGSESVKYFT